MSRVSAVTRVKLADGTRIVGVRVPYEKLKNWRALLEKAGVKIDASASSVIDLVQKEASDHERRGKDETSAGGKGKAPAKAEA